jgi:hypothetical protein
LNLPARSGDYLSLMITLLLHLLRVLPFLVGGHRQLALENLALRQQLAVYRRTVARPRLRRTDRLFWVGLAKVWTAWRSHLLIVTPDTVLQWQRRRFREYWTQRSAQPTGGRPPVNAELRALITRMAAANPLWGAPRIHGELQKLGISVAERTVSRLPRSGAPHRPRRGGRSLPIMPATSSPSTSSPSPPPACRAPDHPGQRGGERELRHRPEQLPGQDFHRQVTRPLVSAAIARSPSFRRVSAFYPKKTHVAELAIWQYT